MKANFEEKVYESYFNSELDRCSEIYFPPGQVLEGNLGFDSSAKSENKELWDLLDTKILSGVNLTSIAKKMEEFLNKQISNIPNLEVNLLFQ